MKTIKKIIIFNDTMRRIKSNKELRKRTEIAKDNTKLYGLNAKFHESKDFDEKAKVSVINERTFSAAMALKKEYENVAVLNFANATCPGGGVKLGCNAQEEALCRCSNLYPTLKQRWVHREFFNPHMRLGEFQYTDNILYTKGITVFKTDVEFPEYTEEWFEVDVITSCAPKQIYKKIDNDILKEILTKRITKILEVAIDNEVEAIVLGAFGCGAFLNPPELVANVFKEVLTSGYDRKFKEIVFAIVSTWSKDANNFDVFKEILNDNI